MNFFRQTDPKTVLEGLDRAQQMLDERYQRKEITIEVYKKQAFDFLKQREKWQKKLSKMEK